MITNMPDLTSEASHKYWFEYKDQTIYRVLSFMESVENWTVDDSPELEEAMKNLGTALDDIGNIDLQKEDDLIKLALHLKAARMLRLLQSLDTANPGTASKILTYAEQNSTAPTDVPGLFLRRNVVFERLRLLGRVLSADRLMLIIKALGGT
jgi:intracellular multiplication protein IcmW